MQESLPLFEPLQLRLVKLPDSTPGIYDIDRDGRKNEMPSRALYAHPALANALIKLTERGVIWRCSDLFRTLESSLQRRKHFADKIAAELRANPDKPPKTKQLAKRPGESPHNAGLSVDFDVSFILSANQISKARFDAVCAEVGLYCHRLDHKRGAEDWHYNALPDPRWLDYATVRSTSRAVESFFMHLYGAQLRIDKSHLGAALDRAGAPKNAAEVDRVKWFQRQWLMDQVDGIAGQKTQRLLAFVNAEKWLVGADKPFNF